MATRVIDDSKLNDIAVAIQAKDNGGQMTVDEMPERIGALQVGNPYQVMNDYIEGTLTRLRLNNVPPGRLKFIQPGGSNASNSDQTIQRIELPNNTNALGVWQFGHMQNLLFFDSGYTPNFDNVCLYGCGNLKWTVIRKNDGYATLFAQTTVPLTSKIAVIPSLIEGYKNETNWSAHADNFRNLYFADSDIEKEALIADSSIPNDSMIVCDYNETYYVKGEGVV